MKIIGYVVYVVAATLVILLSLEGIGRLAIHFEYGVPGKTYGLWVGDQEMGAIHGAHRYNSLTSTNNFGFRNREDIEAERPGNGVRIICFGGSTTYGHNLADDDTWSFRLQQHFRSMPGYAGSEVLNAGRMSQSAGHSWILMQRVVPVLKPDYVIIYEGVNELNNAWALGAQGISLDDLNGRHGTLGKLMPMESWLFRNSVVAKMVDVAAKSFFKKKNDTEPAAENQAVRQAQNLHEVHPWIIANYDHLLRSMIRYLKDNAVKPIVVRYAYVNKYYIGDQELFSNLSRSIAEEEGALVYDMQKDIENYGTDWKELFLPTGVHVIPQGARIVAKGLFDLIRSDMTSER